MQVWLFGSALISLTPADLDDLLVYERRAGVIAVRNARWWRDFQPPLHMIAMTVEEERDYDFVSRTHAERLV
jgi:hypothetical protein